MLDYYNVFGRRHHTLCIVTDAWGTLDFRVFLHWKWSKQQRSAMYMSNSGVRSFELFNVSMLSRPCVQKVVTVDETQTANIPK